MCASASARVIYGTGGALTIGASAVLRWFWLYETCSFSIRP